MTSSPGPRNTRSRSSVRTTACSTSTGVAARVCVRASTDLTVCVGSNRAEDSDQFFKEVVGPLSAKKRKLFGKGWPLHRGFGACCDPTVFHLPGVWGIRQDPDIYRIASTIAGETRLWVDINRSIQKLPGEGDNEFLHWDFNPFTAVKHPERPEFEPKGVCGKVVYTESRFVCVPGTHTWKFLEKMTAEYADLYPHVKPGDPKFGLDMEKPDPLNLVARKCRVRIPAGCLIFWNPKLLHGQEKTPLTDQVEYGCYLGMFPAGARERYREVSGKDELVDRMDSFKNGCAPRLWPSFDEIHYYPNSFKRFPNVMDSYIKKMPPNHPMVQERTTKKGVVVKHLVPLPRDDYHPPVLSLLGRRLLGSEEWPTDKAVQPAREMTPDTEDDETVCAQVPEPPQKKQRVASVGDDEDV